MRRIDVPRPGNLIAGIIGADRPEIDSARTALEAELGRIDIASEIIEFSFTDYYRVEMGSGLLRCWVSFAPLQPLARLAEIKLTTNQLEDRLRDVQGNRRINLDPGFLTMHNVVLATTKNYAHRIYLRDGIFAELTLLYEQGAFRAQRWTYPDYQSLAAQRFLRRVREVYLEKLAHLGVAEPGPG